MALIVAKFGGTSVASPERIKMVARRLIDMKLEGNQPVAVVSAMGKTTDELVGLARALSKHPPAREMDRLLSRHELFGASGRHSHEYGALEGEDHPRACRPHQGCCQCRHHPRYRGVPGY